MIFSACAADGPSVKVEKGLTASELARFNDTFDKFREDLWSVTGFIPGESLRAENFKLADIQVKNGRLSMETKTGGFSGGGMGSTFSLQGDFDIQVDCKLDFNKTLMDMDQVVMLHVIDKSKELTDTELEGVSVGFLKTIDKQSHIRSFFRERGQIRGTVVRPCGDFDGTLRVVRKGARYRTMYKRSGDPEWEGLGQYTRSASEIVVSLRVQNFGARRENIRATSPFRVQFDNFVINSAEKIVESEI